MRFVANMPAFILASILSAAVTAPVALAGEEPRQPPPTRASDVLSEAVFRSISSIQEKFSPEDPNTVPDLEGAKVELDELYQRRYERMNDFEKSTTLNFYTQYYLTHENYPEAIRIFREMLGIENLREDVRLRALRALGQLSMIQEQFSEAIGYFTQWRELSLDEDETIFLGLANCHYSISQYSEAVPYLLSHMELVVVNGGTIDRNKWGLLNVLYIEQEDYVNALEVIKNMIVRFNDAGDWRNLAAIYSFLDQDSNRIGTLSISYILEFMNSDAAYLNLAQSLAGEEAPYTGAKVLVAGIDAGMVPKDVKNLKILVQMYQLSSEFDLAIEPSIELAELDSTGEGYDTLGYNYYMTRQFEKAADAFSQALAKGGLGNESDTALFRSRALVELDRFEEAARMASRAAEAGDRSDQTNANNYLRYVQNQQARHNAIQTRKQNAIEFYRSYN